MTLEEENPDQIYEELRARQEQNQKSKSFIHRIPKKTRLYMAAGIFVFLYYAQVKELQFTKVLMWLGIGLAAIWLLFDEKDGPRELTERECYLSLVKNMLWMQNNPVGGIYRIDPEAKVTVEPVGKKLWLSGSPWKRVFKVMLRKTSGVEDTYTADVDIYNGDLIGMQLRPEGYRGSESPDLKTIAHEDLRKERMATRYLDKKS